MGWVIGAILAGCGSISSNLGVNIQKYSFVKNSQLDRLQQRKYIRQPLWLLGLILVSFGSLGDFIALSMAAQSIVAPIGSVTLVTNVLFAHFGLHEKLRIHDIIGTCMIICGSILSVAFGDHNSKQYTASDLNSLFFGTLFIVYVLLITLLLCILHTFISRINPMRSKLNDTIRRWESCRYTELQTAAQLDIQIHNLEQQYSRFERLHPFSLCATAGLYGSLAVLFGKMVAELLGSTFSGVNQMNEPVTYIYALLMLVFVITQLHYMATALNSFDAMYCVPVFQCFFISGSTLGGACFFNEFAAFGLIQAIFFPIGLTCTLTGVVILSSRQMQLKRSQLSSSDTAQISNKSVSNKHKRKHSNGQYKHLDDTYIDEQTDYIDDLDIINENDELSRSHSTTIQSDVEIDINNRSTQSNNDINTIDPELLVQSLNTSSNKQLLRSHPSNLIASRRGYHPPTSLQPTNKHRKYRESPSPVPGSAKMELSYDTVQNTQTRTPRPHYRSSQYRPLSASSAINKQSASNLPRQRSYVNTVHDPELVEPNSGKRMDSINSSPVESSHDHYISDDELMGDEQLHDRLKWMSSVGNMSGGLYGQLPLLGPLAQIILNAKQQENDSDDDTIATTLFGHQYHELDNDSYRYNQDSISNDIQSSQQQQAAQRRQATGEHSHYISTDIEMNDMNQSSNLSNTSMNSDDIHTIHVQPTINDTSEFNTPATTPKSSNILTNNKLFQSFNQFTNVLTGKSGYNSINTHDTNDQSNNKSLTKALLTRENNSGRNR